MRLSTVFRANLETDFVIIKSILPSRASCTSQSSKISSSVEYSLSKNYPQKIKDSRGNETLFGYDENTGNLNKITDAKQVEVNNTYDDGNRILSESCEEIQNDYSYNNGVLSAITRKISSTANSIYNFTRDAFDNIIETKIRNKTFAKNTFDTGNGLLKQIKYANDQTLNFVYDKLGRVVNKRFGFGKNSKHGEFKYTYDSQNRLVETYDSANDVTTKFSYAKCGRFVKTIRSDGNISRVHYVPKSNLIDKVNFKLFGLRQSLENTFGKGDILEKSKIIIGESETHSNYNFDMLGRPISAEFLNSEETSGIKNEVSYFDYASENEQKTTELVSSVELKKKVWENFQSIGKKFNYTYDELGNITDIKGISNNLIAHYEYDKLGQLVREGNVQTGKTAVYSYNNIGNLTKKEIYAYTAGDLTTLIPENTIVYGYGDENWNDKLTSYGDQKIIYDGMGNPIVYRNGWEFSWIRGQRLDKMKNLCYNTDVSCKYDVNGVRTQKVVTKGLGDKNKEEKITDFVTSGIKLLAQKRQETKF